jgi:hypothetical protein
LTIVLKPDIQCATMGQINWRQSKIIQQTSSQKPIGATLDEIGGMRLSNIRGGMPLTHLLGGIKDLQKILSTRPLDLTQLKTIKLIYSKLSRFVSNRPIVINEHCKLSLKKYIESNNITTSFDIEDKTQMRQFLQSELQKILMEIQTHFAVDTSENEIKIIAKMQASLLEIQAQLEQYRSEGTLNSKLPAQIAFRIANILKTLESRDLTDEVESILEGAKRIKDGLANARKVIEAETSKTNNLVNFFQNGRDKLNVLILDYQQEGEFANISNISTEITRLQKYLFNLDDGDEKTHLSHLINPIIIAGIETVKVHYTRKFHEFKSKDRDLTKKLNVSNYNKEISVELNKLKALAKGKQGFGDFFEKLIQDYYDLKI